MGERVRLDIRDGLAAVGLMRAERHNGVDLIMLREMRAVQRELARRRDVRATLIYGEGPSFCAGPSSPAVSACSNASIG